MRILLNGKDFTRWADLSNFEITLGLNENDRTYNLTTSSEIQMTGDGAEYLKDIFLSNPCDGVKQKVQVSIYDDCCKKWFRFEASAEGFTYCNDCTASIRLKEPSDVNRCYKRLNEKIWWRQGFANAFKHPQVWYINRPGFVQIFIYLISFVVLLIVRLIFELCRAIDAIPGIKLNCKPLEDLICDASEYITGTNWKSPSPYIRNILEYNAGLCGLKLRSSIFQVSNHRNDVLFIPQYERGRRNAVNWIDGNGPNQTTIQLLESLKPVYNLDYRIKNGELIVERKDYFENAEKGVIVDLRGEDTCIEFMTDKNYANGNYHYTDDAIEKEGNRVANYPGTATDTYIRGMYDDRVEWNAEGADWKEGTLDVNPQYGRARFQFDAVSGVIDGKTDFDILFDAAAQLGHPAAVGICNNNETRRDRDLILTDNTIQYVKILQLEPNTNLDDAKVVRKPAGTARFKFFGLGGSFQIWDYNYPMWYDATEPEGLYQTFHYIDDPNRNKRKILKIQDIEVEFDCETLGKILEYPDDYAVMTSYGEAKPKEYVINFENKTIKFTGLEVRC
jgi:hypothetical protein